MKIWMLIVVLTYGSPDLDVGRALSDSSEEYIMVHHYKSFSNKSSCTDLQALIKDKRETFQVSPYYVYDVMCVPMRAM